MPDTRVVEMVVCLTCHRAPDDIKTNEPASGAHPDSYSPATVSAEESAGVVTWYMALHKPGCRRIVWANGTGPHEAYEAYANTAEPMESYPPCPACGTKPYRDGKWVVDHETGCAYVAWSNR